MSSHQMGLTQGSIMVVDDLSDNLLFLSTVLTEQGYEVRCFSIEQMSLGKLETTLPDLLLLNSNAQNEQSDEFWHKLKGDPLASQVPVILIDPSEQTIAKVKAFFPTGGLDYITRPLRVAEILARVETQLTIRCLQRQLQDCRSQLQQEMCDRLTAEQALQRSQEAVRSIEERTNVLLNAIPDKIFRHHIDGSYLDIKGQSGDLIMPREALIESNLRDLPIPEALKVNLLERIRTAITTGQPQTYEHQLPRQDGMHTYESRFVKSGADEAVCIVRDITDRQRAEAALQKANKELERLANLDGLTEIANRRRFDECLHQEWLRVAREQSPLSLILCDIDFFKNYNDTYGHLSGDQCLQQVAKALAATVKRPADLVARYGGEEFAILLPKTNIAGAIQIAEQVRLAVKDLHIRHDDSRVGSYVTISLGVASMTPMVGSQPTVLVTAADHALYQAKKDGRDRLYSIG